MLKSMHARFSRKKMQIKNSFELLMLETMAGGGGGGGRGGQTDRQTETQTEEGEGEEAEKNIRYAFK